MLKEKQIHNNIIIHIKVVTNKKAKKEKKSNQFQILIENKIKSRFIIKNNLKNGKFAK